MAYIDTFVFNRSSLDNIRKLKHEGNRVGENWPVVYVLNNDKIAYVGETVNAVRRADQHLSNKEKRRLTEIRIISDDDFNKSVILDLESFLIKHISADGKYKMLNANNGLQDHDYYERSRYEKEFRDIWNELKKQGLVEQSIDDIENSVLFKYSPYKSLGSDQIEAEQDILRAFAEHKHDKDGVRIIVRGGAGTGKTILAIYLMKLIADANSVLPENAKFDDYIDEDVESVYASESLNGIFKIGIVLPQPSLRASIKDVFKSIKSLKSSMVLGPTDVANNYLKTGEKYDLLIVDEGHRLKSRKNGNMANNGAFKSKCEELGIDYESGSELEWILKCSKHQIIFRDDWQTVRPCDMDNKEFMEVIHKNWHGELIQQFLLSQWRCMGGNDYINYVKDILKTKADEFQNIENYDFKLYNDPNRMINDIKTLEKTYGLCRVAAGFAWEWKTDPRHNQDGKYTYDMELDGEQYKWNSTRDNWIGSKNSINEIGCIHTVQGYDLNYLGVIIGEDLKYDKAHDEIVAHAENYYDSMGKAKIADDKEQLREYLLNIYMTLMTRGIRGTYVYVCDPALREYMSQFIPWA